MSRIRAGTGVAMLMMVSFAACADEPVGIGADDTLQQSGAQASVSGSPRDIAAFHAIVSSLDQNWAVDAVAYAAHYADAEWVGPTGLILTNPNAITGLYTNLFVVAAGTVRQSIIRRITFLTGTIAVLDIDVRASGWTNLPPGVNPWQPGTIRALEKNILVKRAGEWTIVQHQQVTVAPGIP